MRAGSSLAPLLGISPMMVGLTVVSLGTRVPVEGGLFVATYAGYLVWLLAVRA